MKKRRNKKVLLRTIIAVILVNIFCMMDIYAATSLSSSPNAKVEYGYQSEVSCGTIRYISQITSNPYFNSSYWGGWQSQAGIECGTASISMALSYIGINKTPKQILDAHNGITYFSGWGETSYSAPSVSTAVDRYINGNGKYSPPVIHLPGYTSAGHYVVLAGKVSSNVYQVVDPANSNLWNITINGTTASYNGITDTVDQVHQWYNANASIAPTDTTAPVISDVYVKDVSSTGYTVHCIVTDNSGLGTVQFPTWTPNNGQDDLLWGDAGAVAGTGWELNYRVNISDHNNETNCHYYTDIYCYDSSGNLATYKTVVVYIDADAPEIMNVSVSDVSASGYTVTCTVSDNGAIDRVQFPTWTLSNNQDDLSGDWQTSSAYSGTLSGNNVTFRVNTSDHNSETGLYYTHVYAYDGCGNVSKVNLAISVGNDEIEPAKTVYYGGHTYQLYKETFYNYWTEAKTYCESLGGHLVTITSAEEQKMLENFIGIGETDNWYYIGATDEISEGNWSWVTGESLEYTNWSASQPDNYEGNGGEDYGMMYAVSGQWNDCNGNVTIQGFICEFDSVPSYSITYHLDGGTNAASNPSSYTIETSYLALDEPTKEGYEFLGWYTSAEGGEKFTSDTVCEGDLVLYARWEELIPDLSAPENVVITPVNSTRLKVNWDEVAKATGYAVYVAEKENGTYLWMTGTSSGTNTTVTLKGLEIGKQYFVKVKAKYEKDDVKVMSEYSEVTNGYVTPAAPASISVKAEDHTSAMVSWNASTGATAYRVYVSESEDTGFALKKEVTGNDAVSTMIDGLVTGKRYYMKVCAVYESGSVCAESLDSKVKNVLIPPAVPEGLSVVSQGGNAANVSWAASSGATGYAVYMAEESSGPYEWKNATSGHDTTSVTIYNLETGKKYYFVVCAKYEDGTVKVLSKYTSAKSVRITPAVPQKLTLTADSYESVRVSWKAATGATGYAVYMSESENGTYSWKKATTGNDATSTVIYGLETGKTYYFKVISKYETDEVKVLSDYCDEAGIQVVPKSPSSFKVVSETMDSVTASWKAVAGATGYEVYWSDIKDGTYTLGAVTEGNETVSATITGLATAQKYYFKVLAKYETDDVDVDSAFSAIKATVVLPETPVNITAANDNTTTVVVKWGEVEGATGYVIYMSEREDGIYEWKGSASATGKLRVYVKGLEVGKTYYFKVRAKTEIDGIKSLSDYSEAISIMAVPAIPGSFKLSARDYETATLSWNKVADCTGYAIYQSNKADSGFMKIKSINGNTITSADITGLESGKRYYFKVRALYETDDISVESEDSAIKSVLIPELIPEVMITAGSTGENTTILTATTMPTGSSVTWSSSNTSVATVSDGVVTSKGEGTTVITAKMTYDGVEYTDNCTITVGKDVSYGSWSSYSINEALASANQEVRTTTLYRYYCFYCPVCGGREPFIGTSDCGSYTLGLSNAQEIWSTIPYSQSNYKSYSYTTSKLYTTSLEDGQVWNFSAGNLYSTSVGTLDSDSDAVVIRTGYSTRSVSTSYYINTIS